MKNKQNIPVTQSIGDFLDQAIKDQQIILGLELEKGVPLNYLDENDRYVLRYQDGRIEQAELPVIKQCRS